MEIDRSLELLDVVVEATGRFLSPLDRRVGGFHARMGPAMLQMQIGNALERWQRNERRDLRY